MQYVFRLFVVGSSEHTSEAIRNFWAITSNLARSSTEMQIIDVCQYPDAAEAYNVYVTPTLIRVGEGSTKRVFGDLSNHSQVLAALDIPSDSV